MLPVGAAADKSKSARTNRAPMDCWLEPTRLTLAAAYFFSATASHATTHCHAAAAIKPSPKIRFGLMREFVQSLHAARSAASVRGLLPRPSQSSSLEEFLPS